MSSMRPTSAKIMQHGEGFGAPTAETVRRRARELALIDGRRDFTEEDWRAACRELHGGHDLNDSADEPAMSAAISEHDMVAGSLGRHTQRLLPEDAGNVIEELIAEGMDEAIHEQMLAARQADAQDDAAADEAGR